MKTFILVIGLAAFVSAVPLEEVIKSLRPGFYVRALDGDNIDDDNLGDVFVDAYPELISLSNDLENLKSDEEWKKIQEEVQTLHLQVKNTTKKACVDTKCSYCFNVAKKKVCMEALVDTEERTLTLDIKYGGMIILSKTLDPKTPPPLCFGVKLCTLHIVDLCLQPYGLKFTKGMFHACLRLDFLVLKQKLASLDFHCVNLGKKRVH